MTSGSRAIAVVAACAIGAAGLTGCGPVNAGTAAADDFEKAFSGVDGVASVEASGSNNLPFVGSVSAEVTTEADLDDAEVDEIADDLAAYMEDEDAISWDVALTADALTVGVATDGSMRDLRLAVARDLIAMPFVVTTRVAVEYEDVAVLVEVDAPESLSDGYAAASEAIGRLGIDDGRSNAGATAGADGAFTVDDESWDGEENSVEVPLRILDAALTRFTLTAAEITPETLELRAADEDDIALLEAFVAAIPGTAGLEIDIQGGKTTTDADATASADAVAEALRDLETVTRISASGNYVVATVGAPGDAPAVLAAASADADFAALTGFTIMDAETDFRVYDRPADFAASLEIGLTASALPALESVEAVRLDEYPAPSIQLRFDHADEKTMAAFVTSMKPALVAGGWDVWINADGYVESFLAEDSITLEEQVTGDRTTDEQEFADTLVRLWDAAATS